MQPSFDSYSGMERRFLAPARRIGLALLRPFVVALARLGISPNMVSLSQIPIGVAVVFLITPAPRLAFVLMIVAIAVDGLDGALARYLGRSSRYGALVDQYADHVREILVVAGLAYAGALNGALAALYALAYTGNNVTLLLCNAKGVPLAVAVKTFLVFYPALFLYLWLGLNYLDAAVALVVLLMALSVMQGMRRLRGAMDY